jgi:hypothetical protein
MSDYRYRHFTFDTLIEEMYFAAGSPAPGEPFPDFDLPTTDGGRICKNDYVGRRPMFMVAASFT